MKFGKAGILILSGMLIISSAFTGCTGKDKSSNENTGETFSGKYVASEKHLELTIHSHLWNSSVFKDDKPVFRKAEEMTNVKLKGTASQSAADSQQIFNIMVASGELPDIVNYLKPEIEKFAAEGAFVPLNDLIDQYAPHLKKFIDENEDAKKYMTAPDGNIYVIPNLMDGQVAKGWMIRKDWLDKLNLKVPTTVDEYYNVLKAFRANDLNGNGKKDEIPFFVRDNNTAASELLALFGVRTKWGVKDGKVQYGEYTPEYKNAMINIAKWYAEDLIDKEIFTRGSKARDILFGENNGGSTHDWFTSTASYNYKVKEKYPEFNLIPMAPPADINGKVWEESSRGISNDAGWAISINNKYPVETIKFFDFWFTEEGRRLANFGVEGEQYDMVDGKPKFKDEIINGKKPATVLLNEIGAQLPFGYKQDFSYEEQIMDPIAREGVKMYMENNYIIEQFPKITLTPEEKAKFDEKWPGINTFIKETMQKWVLGAEPVEGNFENYMTKLKEMGMDEIIDIYQKAYDRYQNQK